MYRKQAPVGGADALFSSPVHRWNAATCAVAGCLALAAGSLFLSSVTTQLGVFPTLFLGTVIAGCVSMQLSELATHER